MTDNAFVSNPSIVVDLSNIVKQVLISGITIGDNEVSEISKQLAGLNYQPSFITNIDFNVAKSFFHNAGASDQASSTLALLVGTIARVTNQSIQEVIFEVSLDKFSFERNAFQILNQNVSSAYNQLSQFQETTPDQSYNRNFKQNNNPEAVAINFTSSPITNITVGNVYNYIVTTNDGFNGSTLKYVSASKPSWLIFFDVGNGVGQLTGTPTNVDIGIYEIEFIVNNDKGIPSTQKFQLQVNYINHAPSFTSTQISSVKVLRTYEYQITAIDPDLIYGDHIIITAPVLPGWLQFSDNHDGTALLVGTAPFLVNTYSVHLLVTDSHSLSATQNFTISVQDNNPTFETNPILNGYVGLVYSYHVATTDEDIVFGDTIILTTSTLPGWLTFVDNGDTTGRLHGTPVAASTYNITITATDSFGQFTNQVFTITTAFAPQLQTIYEDDNHIVPTPIQYNSITSLVDTIVGTINSMTVTLTNNGSGNLNISNLLLTGDSNYQFHSMPSPTYTITPTNSHSFQIDNSPIETTAIRNSQTVFSFVHNDITITTPFRTSLISRILPMQIQISGNYAPGIVGILYVDNMVYTITGGYSAYTWSIFSGTLPGGLTINSSTGVISGTPTTPGTFNFSITIIDNASAHGSLTNNISILTFQILISQEFLIIGTLPDVDIDTAYSHSLTTVGGQAPIQWNKSSGDFPPGISIRTDTGLVSGTPLGVEAGKRFNFVIQAIDALGNLTSSTQTITIVSLPIVTGSLPNAEETQSYSSGLSISDGAPPYNWFVTSGTLPGGTSIDSSTGIISGTLTNSGSFIFTVNAQDENGGIGSNIQHITIFRKVSLSGTLATPAIQGIPYSSSITLFGGQAPYVWSVLSGILPDGLSLNSSTGVISGTPTNIAVNETFQLKVIDNFGVFTTSFQTVAVNTNVSLSGTLTLESEVSIAYSSGLTASGGVPPYSWATPSGNIPSGLTIDSSTGIISGTPTIPGSYVFNVYVVDTNFTFDIVSQTINVADVVSLTGTLSNADSNVPYSSGLTAVNGTAPYSWSIIAGSLPSGLTINSSTGIISGTTTATGAYTITVQVVDNFGLTASSVQVFHVFSIFELFGTLVNGELTAPYSNGLTPENGTSPYFWTITLGSLPPGLSMSSSTGLITGTPTTIGNYNFTIHIADNTSQLADSNQTVIINNPPALSGTLSDADKSAFYSDSLSIVGGVLPATWSITVGSLPTGLTIDSSTGIISGTPTVLGSSSFTVGIIDFYGLTTTSNQTINVTDVPSITGTFANGTVGVSYSSGLSISNGISPFVWSIAVGVLPGGLSINSSSGLVTGTPTTHGTYSFIIEVADVELVHIYKSASIIII